MTPCRFYGKLSPIVMTISHLLLSSVLLAKPGPQPGAETPGSRAEMVLLPSPGSPLVAIRLMFRVGSMHDPKGKEGLAALTGLMIGSAGTEKRSYRELVDAFYPMAASINVQTDREVTVLWGEIHQEKLAEFTALFREALLEPGFAASDLERNKQQLLAFLTTTLRSASDELLGLEAIQQSIFRDHPYSHAAAGTVAGLTSITLEDVRKFYDTHYTQANLILGLAGGYPDEYVGQLAGALTALPKGKRNEGQLPAPSKIKGRRFTVIEKETDSVGIHFGFPLPLTRAQADYFPLMVANSFLGEHRTFHGRLMVQLRQLRGLNYGDYSYIEYWFNPPATSTPSPNVPRHQQYFSVWIRPVVPATAHFALRNALYEVDRLVEQGLTRQEFELTRDFLINYSKLWSQTLSQRLGFALDSRYYGTPDYVPEIEKRLSELTLEEVNRVVRKYLSTENFEAVFVTPDAETTKAFLEGDAPSPLTYQSQVSDEVLQTDKVIERLKVAPSSIRVVSAQEMFQGSG